MLMGLYHHLLPMCIFHHTMVTLIPTVFQRSGLKLGIHTGDTLKETMVTNLLSLICKGLAMVLSGTQLYLVVESRLI